MIMEKKELIRYIESIKFEISQSDRKSYLISTRLNRLFLLLKEYSDVNGNDKLREYAMENVVDMGRGYGKDASYEKDKMIGILNGIIGLL